MSLEEIKSAIAELPEEKRRNLVDSIVPRFVELSADDETRIQAEFDAVPEDGWIDWEDLKAQTA
ncbi:MAG: hypothetical protein ACI8UO_005284 [Verrucomicrobiales bacterium]|jgi:hypothetical protein